MMSARKDWAGQKMLATPLMSPTRRSNSSPLLHKASKNPELFGCLDIGEIGCGLFISSLHSILEFTGLPSPTWPLNMWDGKKEDSCSGVRGGEPLDQVKKAGSRRPSPQSTCLVCTLQLLITPCFPVGWLFVTQVWVGAPL